MNGYELVTTPERLAAVAAELAAASLLAVDTEFVRRTTFYARPGLLQLSAGGAEYLVDLVALPDLSPLKPVFLAESPLKLMHACSEDLEVLKGLFGAVPGSLVDTQVAAALLGHPLQMSYQKLIKAALDIDVPKDETQSDWMARPLSESQLSYAALDVRYLLPLWQKLNAALRARGRDGWLREDCARLLADASREPDPTVYYRQIGGASRLRPAKLALLSQLVAWRETTARLVDKPRSHVVADGVLLAIAQRRPESASQLRLIADFHPASLRRYGDDVLAIVRRARGQADSCPLVEPVPPPLPREAKGVLSALRDVAVAAAKDLGVEVEVLVRRRHQEALVEGVRNGSEPALPPMLAGWRRAVVGDRLLAAVKERAAEIHGWETEPATDD